MLERCRPRRPHLMYGTKPIRRRHRTQPVTEQSQFPRPSSAGTQVHAFCEFPDQRPLFNAVDDGDVRVIQRREHLRFSCGAREIIGIVYQGVRSTLMANSRSVWCLRHGTRRPYRPRRAWRRFGNGRPTVPGSSAPGMVSLRGRMSWPFSLLRRGKSEGDVTLRGCRRIHTAGRKAAADGERVASRYGEQHILAAVHFIDGGDA